MKEILWVFQIQASIEGNKVYIYRVDDKNIANKTEIQIGNRSQGYSFKVKSGLKQGDVVAEGLKVGTIQ